MMPSATVTEKEIKAFYASRTTLQDVLGRFGCWMVLIAQYLIVDGLAHIQITPNIFSVLLFGEFIYLASLSWVKSVKVVRDMLEISVYSLIYYLLLFIAYTLKLHFYEDLAGQLKTITSAMIILAAIRLFWSFSIPGTRQLYDWPIFGLVGLTLRKHTNQSLTTDKKHSILVYLVLILVILIAKIDYHPPSEEYIKRIFAGVITLGLFFKYFHPYMRESIGVFDELGATKDELIFAKTELATTKEVLADVAEAKTAAEIELEEQRMLATLAKKFSPEQIATLHEFTQMDREMQMRFNSAIRAARAAQLIEEAENELKQKRPALRLVVSDLDDTQ